MRENDYGKALENLTSKGTQFEAFDRRRNVGVTTGSFYFQRARVKIVMLRLLQHRLVDKSPYEVEQARIYLQQNGAASMKSILRKQRSVRSDAGTKFIAIRHEETGFSSKASALTGVAEELFVDQTALELLDRGKENEFFDRRRDLIEDSERDFVFSLGLDSNDEERQN